MDDYGVLELVAGIVTLFTLLVTFRLVAAHMRCPAQPFLRQYYIRCAVHPSIIAVFSLIGIIDPKDDVIYRLFIYNYSAFALFSLVQLYLSYAGGAQNLANLLNDGQLGDWRHAPPCRFCGKFPCLPCYWFGCNKPWKMGADFVKKTVFRTVLFCAVLPPLTLVVFITFLVPRDADDDDTSCSDVFCDGQMEPNNFYFYWMLLWVLLMANSIVSLRAFTSVTRDILLPISPRRKMLYTTALIIVPQMTSFVIAQLYRADVVDDHSDLDGYEWSRVVFNFVVNMVSFFFALAATWHYSSSELSNDSLAVHKRVEGSEEQGLVKDFIASFNFFEFVKAYNELEEVVDTDVLSSLYDASL